MKVSLHAMLAGAFVAATGFPVDAGTTTTRVRSPYYQPAFNCQGSMPAHDGKLRKRPLAIANEGTTTAFISCGLSMDMAELNVYGSDYIYVVITNRSAVNATVNCTLVEGYAGVGQDFHVKSVELAPGDVVDTFAWNTSDNNGLRFMYPSISCALPPGVEINGTSQQYEETIV